LRRERSGDFWAARGLSLSILELADLVRILRSTATDHAVSNKSRGSNLARANGEVVLTSLSLPNDRDRNDTNNKNQVRAVSRKIRAVNLALMEATV
jgi:hypothetical protein